MFADYLEIENKIFSRLITMAKKLETKIEGYTERSFLPQEKKSEFLENFNYRYSRLFN